MWLQPHLPCMHIPCNLTFSEVQFFPLECRSTKHKTVIICDLIINNSIDISAINETCLSGDHCDHQVLPDLNNIWSHFQCHHVLRINRAGGGVFSCLKKGFHSRQFEAWVFYLLVYKLASIHFYYSVIVLLLTYNHSFWKETSTVVPLMWSRNITVVVGKSKCIMHLAMLTGSRCTKLQYATFAAQGPVYERDDRLYLAKDSAEFVATD